MRIGTRLALFVGTVIGFIVCYSISSPIQRDIHLYAEGDFSDYRFFEASTTVRNEEEAWEVGFQSTEAGGFHGIYGTSFMETHNIRLVAVPRSVVHTLGCSQVIAAVKAGNVPNESHCFQLGAHSKTVPFCDPREDVTARYRLTAEPHNGIQIAYVGQDVCDWPTRLISLSIGFFFFGCPLAALVRHLRKARVVDNGVGEAAQ